MVTLFCPFNGCLLSAQRTPRTCGRRHSLCFFAVCAQGWGGMRAILQYADASPGGHLMKKKAEEPVPIPYLELLGTTLEKRRCLSQDVEDQ